MICGWNLHKGSFLQPLSQCIKTKIMLYVNRLPNCFVIVTFNISLFKNIFEHVFLSAVREFVLLKRLLWPWYISFHCLYGWWQVTCSMKRSFLLKVLFSVYIHISPNDMCFLETDEKGKENKEVSFPLCRKQTLLWGLQLAFVPTPPGARP